MKKKVNWMKSFFYIILITSLTYVVASHYLEKHFNLLFRDWVFASIIAVLSLSGLIIETVILIKLNNMFEKNLSIKTIWKRIMKLIFIALILVVNFYIFLICIFSIDYEEVGVEIYNGNRYVVKDTSGWLSHHPSYKYHLYVNIFVYDKDVKYSQEFRFIWNHYLSFDEDEENKSKTIPKIPDVNTTIEKEEMEITSANLQYVQKVNNNLHYGFYLIDRAAHQYSYAFVQSNDGGLSWEAIYQFPANSELYYGIFLNKETGFINFASSEELSLFMTIDSGLTWEKVLINLPEENKNKLYVRDIKENGEQIEVILGTPSWSNLEQNIKYISVDKGVSWDLQI